MPQVTGPEFGVGLTSRLELMIARKPCITFMLSIAELHAGYGAVFYGAALV